MRNTQLARGHACGVAPRPDELGHCEPLEELARLIPMMSLAERDGAFIDLSRRAARLPELGRRRSLQALAAAIPELPEAARQEAFDRTLGMSSAIPYDHRADVLQPLVFAAASLPEASTSPRSRHAGRAPAFDAILRSLDVLSHMQRESVLAVLASRLDALSE